MTSHPHRPPRLRRQPHRSADSGGTIRYGFAALAEGRWVRVARAYRMTDLRWDKYIETYIILVMWHTGNDHYL